MQYKYVMDLDTWTCPKVIDTLSRKKKVFDKNYLEKILGSLRIRKPKYGLFYGVIALLLH